MREEPIFSSFEEILPSSKVVVVYSRHSKKVWKKVKSKLGGLFKVNEVEADFSNFEDILAKISPFLLKGRDILINITGLSKEGSIALLLYFMINEMPKVKIMMLQMNEKKFLFSPKVFVELVCNKKKRNGLSYKILRILKEEKEVDMAFLVKKLKRAKSTISDSLKTLEIKGLIEKNKEGRRVKVTLNEYIYDLLLLLGGRG